MAKGNWKVTINLRKQGSPVITLAGFAESGDVIRSIGTVDDKRNLAGMVEQHLKSVELYDPALHQRSHDLASAAAKSQVDK